MPVRAARLCGCGAVVQDGGQCRACSSRRDRESGRPSARKRGYDTRWDQASRAYLGKHPYCAMCSAEGKQVLATVLDHITPHRGDMTLFWQRSNWAGLCDAHHSGDKQAMEATGRAGSATTTARVELVCGPPGSGKSTHVDKHRQRGDLIIDMDTLFMALSGQPQYDKPAELVGFVKDMQKHALQRLTRSTSVRRAWIITQAPHARDRDAIAREFNANVTVFAVPASICMRHICNDPRRRALAPAWRKLVDDWWMKWQPRPGFEHVITGARVVRVGGTCTVLDHAPGPALSPTHEEILE